MVNKIKLKQQQDNRLNVSSYDVRSLNLWGSLRVHVLSRGGII